MFRKYKKKFFFWFFSFTTTQLLLEDQIQSTVLQGDDRERKKRFEFRVNCIGSSSKSFDREKISRNLYS